MNAPGDTEFDRLEQDARGEAKKVLNMLDDFRRYKALLVEVF
jgi:hypothetical protein